MKCYHLGYWLNQYAKWYRIESFSEPIDLVRWLQVNASQVESIDFISYKEF